MRRHFKATTVVAAVGVLLISGLPSVAQETNSAGQSPELKVLGRFVGTWGWRITLRPAEWAPKEKTITFDMKNEWILDARMIQLKWAWSPGDETIHCTMLMGYDAEKEHYTEWYFDSTGAVPEGESRRTWDKTTKTFTGWSRSPNGQTTTQTHRFINDDTFEWKMVIKDQNGTVMADMEGVAKRK